MSANKKILVHLGQKQVAFEVVKHRKVFTGYDLAQTLGVELGKIAKSLLVRVELPEMKKKDAKHYLVVVPSSYNLDLPKIKQALKAVSVEIAPEKVLKQLGIEPGATSPFGSVRGLGVMVDKTLLAAKEILVGAESFTESLRMRAKDIVKAEAEAMVGVFGKDNKMAARQKAVAKQEAARAKQAKTERSKAHKAAVKQAAAQKAARKPVAKKSSAKKPDAKKTSTKKAPAKKATAKRPAAASKARK
jgi:prolyl-tRNA editing enzyme YbaK/EbsC (Cys-tRNA(Pro) deacylase)